MTTTKTGSEKSIRAFLTTVLENETNCIRFEVASEALNYDNSLNFFQDLFQHGCVSGMVSKLVYYKDTHDFFDKYYEEIESLRLDWFEQTGQSIYIDSDLKNGLAWFAFETTAQQLYSEWEHSDEGS